MAFVVERDMNSYVLDFKAVDGKMCILRIKTKFNDLIFINVHVPTDEPQTGSGVHPASYSMHTGGFFHRDKAVGA